MLESDAIEKLIEDAEFHWPGRGQATKSARDQLERLKSELAQKDFALKELNYELEHCPTCAKREAECAAMRACLEDDETFLQHQETQASFEARGSAGLPNGPCKCARCKAIRSAISGQAGADLLARLSALEADKRRLDWLDGQSFQDGAARVLFRRRVNSVVTDWENRRPLRQAIDTALARDQKEKQQ